MEPRESIAGSQLRLQRQRHAWFVRHRCLDGAGGWSLLRLSKTGNQKEGCHSVTECHQNGKDASQSWASTHMKGRLVSKVKAPGCSCSIAVGAPLTTLPLTTRENDWAETRRAGFTAFLMRILAAQKNLNFITTNEPKQPASNLLF
jgi:hypothetical protein